MLIVLLVAACTVSERACAQVDSTAYARFVHVSGQGDVPALLGLAKEFTQRPSADDRYLALVASAVADFRSDRLAGCAQWLDSLRRAEPKADDRLLAVMHKFQAGVLQRTGDRRSGMEEIDAGLALADSVRLPMERTDLLVMKAEFLFDEEANDAALGQLRQAQRIAERVNYTRGLCMVRINMGNFRYGQERWSEAWTDYERSLRMATTGGFDLLAVNCANNLGAVAAATHEYALALHLFDSLLTALGGQRPSFRALLTGQLGYVYALRGDHATALPLYERAIALSDSLGDTRGAAESRQYLSSTLWEVGRRKDAIAERNKVLHTMIAAGDGHMEVETRWILWEWYEAIGDKDAALHEARVMSLLDDSLEHDRYNDRLALNEVRFETERKDHHIAQQQQTLQLARTEDARKRTQRDLAIAIAAAVALLAYFIIDRRRRNARHEQEQAILRERLRIADDMHDDLGAGLSSLKLRSEIALGSVEDPRQQEQLRLVADTADALIGNMREILWAMGTEHTTLPDLAHYISVYARRFLEERDLAIEVRVPNDLPAIEVNAIQRRNIFLMVKEALHNVVKHANAHHVSLRIAWNGALELTVADDGIGLANAADTQGNGMRTMRKRAAALGGQVTVRVVETGGTAVVLRVPLVAALNKRSIAGRTEQQDLRSDG